jgi:hypothetical protein
MTLYKKKLEALFILKAGTEHNDPVCGERECELWTGSLYLGHWHCSGYELEALFILKAGTEHNDPVCGERECELWTGGVYLCHWHCSGY